MKGIMIAVAVLFVASMFYGLGYRGLKGDEGRSGKSDLIAKVNGRTIDTLRFREIFNRVASGFGQNIGTQDLPFVANLALGQAINFSLMVGEAEKRVRVSGKEIDGAVDNIMRQQKIASQKELSNALKRVGISFGKFRDLIKEEIMVQKLSAQLRDGIRVTPDDLKEVRASHILVTLESEAKGVLTKLNSGQDFAALAKQYSKDPGSAAKGGDLGYFSRGNMVEPFENAAFSLKPGQTSGLVKTQYGYHIIKVIDSRLRKFPGDQKNIEQLALREKQDKTFRRWYADVQSKAKIEIISPEFKAHDLRFKGRMAEAATEYKKAITQNPDNAFLHVFLGDTYLGLGQKDLALAEYENAIRVQGSNPELYLIMGKAYENTGRKELAIEQFKKASMISGDNKALHERLLKVFESMKQPAMVALERKELKRLESKEKFEKDLNSQK
jgi:foldase protein PrsA